MQKFYSDLFHLPLMQKLLFSFISHFFHGEGFIRVNFAFSHSEVLILIHFVFFLCRSCYSCSFHLPPMQKDISSYISPFRLLLVQKLLFLFPLSSSHGEVVILLHFILFSCRGSYSCSFHTPP